MGAALSREMVVLAYSKLLLFPPYPVGTGGKFLGLAHSRGSRSNLLPLKVTELP